MTTDAATTPPPRPKRSPPKLPEAAAEESTTSASSPEEPEKAPKPRRPVRPPPPLPGQSASEPAADDKDPKSALRVGQAVYAYYHANDHPTGYRLVRMADAIQPPSADAPPAEGYCALGLTTGWIPATVSEIWQPEYEGDDQRDGRVLVKLSGSFFDTYRLEGEEPVDGMHWRVRREHVRFSQPAIELSLFIVRWHDYYNQRLRTSKTHNVANEEMLLDALQRTGSPHEALGPSGSYEVHSAFIRSAADLELIDERCAGVMRGSRKAAMYFLWPSQRPAKKRAGCVPEPQLFKLMQRMEGAGVRSAWPHESKLYRQLSGKLWPAPVCRSRSDLRIPKTVAITWQQFDDDPVKAAEDALLQLQGLAGQGMDADTSSYQGVAKLGFSWMGEDVRPFKGCQQLVKVLHQLFDGVDPSMDVTCLIQERILHAACEFRFVCCRDLASGPLAMQKELARMKLKPQGSHRDDDTFQLTDHNTMSQEEAVRECFFGSVAACETAERSVARLTDSWLKWLQDEGYETPATIRLDFLVSVKPPAGAGQTPEVNVWTMELCENGGSFCGLKILPRTVAVLNDLLREGEPVKGFPKALPPFSSEFPPTKLPPVSAAAGARSERPDRSSGGGPPGRGGPRGRNDRDLQSQPRKPGSFTLLLARFGLDGRAIVAALVVLFVLWRSRRASRAALALK
eukprot:TRINITY_DN83240_c0_g1_i1.p1 TRINITY_DN83240_c0_g1~~TRINITY_DN83240_c0_g1_i1.p1  ORF type:complete len:682 (-),score=117.64 TRINITY_DN83240_c0_g1_i1:190-2235(-)